MCSPSIPLRLGLILHPHTSLPVSLPKPQPPPSLHTSPCQPPLAHSQPLPQPPPSHLSLSAPLSLSLHLHTSLLVSPLSLGLSFHPHTFPCQPPSASTSASHLSPPVIPPQPHTSLPVSPPQPQPSASNLWTCIVTDDRASSLTPLAVQLTQPLSDLLGLVRHHSTSHPITLTAERRGGMRRRRGGEERRK